MRKSPARPARFPKTQHIIAVLIPALIVILTITGFVWAQKGVTVLVDGESLFLKTQADDVAGLLSQADIEVNKGDLVSPSLDAEVADGMSVVVRHAVPVKLVLGGETLELPVVGNTVADALVAVGADPGAGLSVEPALTEPLSAGMTITARDVYVRIVEEPFAVPYGIATENDADLAYGTRVVSRPGVPGKSVRVYQVLVVDGVAGARTLKAERVVTAPVDEIVSVGTKRATKQPTRSRSIAAAPKGGRQLTVVTTAYAPGADGVDTHTATGAHAGFGIIAVDPRVIPLGTRVYVPGYGYAVAADTGGAIKGNKIDVCFDTGAEAIRWGRRTVTITILP